MRMARAYDEEDHPLSERGIEQQNEGLLRRYREFRRGADAVWHYSRTVNACREGPGLIETLARDVKEDFAVLRITPGQESARSARAKIDRRRAGRGR